MRGGLLTGSFDWLYPRCNTYINLRRLCRRRLLTDSASRRAALTGLDAVADINKETPHVPHLLHHHHLLPQQVCFFYKGEEGLVFSWLSSGRKEGLDGGAAAAANIMFHCFSSGVVDVVVRDEAGLMW